MRRHLLVALGAACAAGSHPPAEQRPDPAPASAAVESLLSRAVAALERGEIDVSSVAPDAFSWGAGPRDVFTSRDALARSAPGEKFTAQALDRRVSAAADGRSAWFWEVYTRSGRLVRHTGLAGRADGGWMVLAQHTSLAHPDQVTSKMDESGTLPALLPVGDGIGPGAEEIAALFREAVFIDRAIAAVGGPEFVWIGTEADMIGSMFKGSGKPREDGPGPKDGVRAGLGPGGLTGWAAANVEWIEKSKRKLGPMRFMFVFARQAGTWRLVQNHHSYALE